MSESTIVSEDALRAMVGEHGVRGTARLLRMDERQTDAFRQRVTRGKWMQDPAIAAMRAKLSPTTPFAPAVAMLSPAQANAAELQRLGSETRLSLSRTIAKAGTHLETLSGAEVVDRSGDVKAIAQTADLVHGWKDSAPQVKIRLDILGGGAEPMHDVGAIEIEHEAWVESDPLDDY